MNLSQEQQGVLVALIEGSGLKAHRYLDGAKIYRLHSLSDDTVQEISSDTIERLRNAGLIVSNMKFPVATYMLTPKGAHMAATLANSAQQPLTPRTYRDHH